MGMGSRGISALGVVAAAAVLMAAAGCGKAARQGQGSSPPAATLRSSDTSLGSTSRDGFPLVAKDAQGMVVRLERRPQRIVSAAPTVTEILFALGAGDRVVGVTDQCDYPPEVEGRSRIGGYWTPSVERTLGARPDLVIASRGNPPDFLAAVRKSGSPVFTIDPKTLEGIFRAIEEIARTVGAERAGEELIGGMRGRLAAVAARVSDVPQEKRPTAFIVLQVSPVWTAGSGTFQDDAIRAAGGKNLAADVKGFKPYSIESLAAADPDFLLLSTMEGDPERMKREVVASPAFRGLSAVREGRIVVLEADPIMRPGPRIVEAVEEMARGFYPGRFGAAGRPSSAAARVKCAGERGSPDT